MSLSNVSPPRPQQFDVRLAADGDDGSEDDCTDYGDEDVDEEIIDEASQPGKARVQALTKDQLLLCSATLKGYSLKNKKWRK